MSVVTMQPEDHTGELSWPEGWRHTGRRARNYAAKGVLAARSAGVDVDGAHEIGLLLPITRTPRWQTWLFAVLGLVFGVFSVALLVLAVTDGRWTAVVGVLLLGSVAAIFLAAALASGRQRPDAVTGLMLTPSRLVFDAGVDRLALSWDEVSDLRLWSLRYGWRALPQPWHNWVGIEVHDAASGLTPAGLRPAGRLARSVKSTTAAALPDARFGMNPLVAYHALRFYLDDPTVRPELATPAAVLRVQRGRFH